MVYLLDANVFIQAKNLHYGFDFCPAFWNWLILKNDQGIVFSIEAIYRELIRGNDDLANWVTSYKNTLFLNPDAEIVSQFSVVSAWANEPSLGYEQAAINEFLDVGDYYLVCHALGHQMTIVTHERASHSKKKIKIPDACQALGIRFMSPFEMLRRESARFVL
jgi:hypothetical protein